MPAADVSITIMSSNDNTTRLEDEEIVDIETVSDRTATQFDMNKARTLMTECERHMRVARPHHSHSTEDPINRFAQNYQISCKM